MSFLDRFKRKPQPADNPAPVPEKKKAEPAKKSPDAKGPVIGQLIPQKVAPSADEIRLELGDFLHRIPVHLLLPGPHELKSELRFQIADLSQRIAKGQTMVNLAEIYRRIPQIFRSEVLESDGIEIRFPWQKIAKLVTNVKSASPDEKGSSPAPALAEKLRATLPARPGAKTGKDAAPPPPSPPSGPVLPGRGGAGQASWFTRTGTDKPGERPVYVAPQKPAAAPAGTPPVSEKPAGGKTSEDRKSVV